MIIQKIRMMDAAYEAEDRINAVIESPDEETVIELMSFLNGTIFGFNNNPDSWNRVRGLWNVVNRSNRVTTPTKERFLATLMKKGLQVSNTSVNDNFGE